MDVRVLAADGCAMPPGSHVAVRFGDMMKQGRYDPARSYHFPKQDSSKGALARIDVFRLVGSGKAIITDKVADVDIKSHDPTVANLKLKVSGGAGGAIIQSPKQNTEPRTAQRQQAQEYLASHGIETVLAEAVQKLLKHRPDEPLKFLVSTLSESLATQGEPKGKPKPAARPAGKPVQAVLPFGEYYAGNVRQMKSAAWSKLHAKFPTKRPAVSPKRDVAVALPAQKPSGPSPPTFQLKPSVGTWLATKPPKISAPSPSSRAFQLLPSVGTWLAPKPPQKSKSVAPVFNMKPSVGTWLQSRRWRSP